MNTDDNGKKLGPYTRVVGALLGKQEGKVVEIVNSIELKFTDLGKGSKIDLEFMK